MDRRFVQQSVPAAHWIGVNGRRMLSARLISAVLISFSLCLLLTAESSVTPEQADQYLRAQDWKNAAVAYEHLTRSNPGNGRYWLRLGVSHIKLHEYNDALAPLKRAEELKFFPDRTSFELAVAYAGSGDRDAAVEWLNKALEAGFADSESLDESQEFALLKGSPAFDAIHQRLARPCENDPNYRVLDFWVGTWEVRSPKGDLEGHNEIVKLLNSCAIQENWSSSSHHDGKSLFYYDVVRKQWKQVWLTDDGNMKEKILTERYQDGGTRFQGTLLMRDGSSVLDRTTLTPLSDGRVRQVIEQSADGGKTWGSWEGIYSRTQASGR